MRFDELLKEMLQSTHARLLEKVAGSAIRRWLNVELPVTQMRRVDLLAELENGNLFHLELQSRNDPRMGQRLLAYRLLIEDVLGRAPAQMVLYVGWEALGMNGVLEGQGLRFEYMVRDIRTLDPGELTEGGRIEDRILLVLLGADGARERALAVLREIETLPHPERGDALAKLLVTSGLRRLHSEIRKEMEHMPLLSDLLENPFLQDWFKEGEAKGRALGEAKARAEDAVRFVTRILEHRFGPLPEWAQEKIRATPAEKLESMVGQVLEAETLDQAMIF